MSKSNQSVHGFWIRTVIVSQFLLFYYQNNNDYKKAATDFNCIADDSFLSFYFFLSCAVADTSY